MAKTWDSHRVMVEAMWKFKLFVIMKAMKSHKSRKEVWFVLERKLYGSVNDWLQKGDRRKPGKPIRNLLYRLCGTVSSNCGTGEKEKKNGFEMYFKSSITWTWWLFGWGRKEEKSQRFHKVLWLTWWFNLNRKQKF